MIDDFPLIRQSSGENDCLPAAVEAIVLWNGVAEYSRTEIARICRMTEEGCAWYDAVEGLREHFDVEEFPASDADTLMDTLYDAVENDEEPVAVRIAVADFAGDIYGHAVVVVGFVNEEEIRYMDPLPGEWRILPRAVFRQRWLQGGGFALIVRP